MKTLTEAIKESTEVELDAAWSLLKRKDLGILRKLRCLALIYCLEESDVLAEAPKDAAGRIIDKASRDIICQSLLSVSPN